MEPGRKRRTLQARLCVHCYETQQVCAEVQAAFEATRSSLVERPWAVDDLDRILQHWQEAQYQKALLFVDNAGSDVILGGPLALLLV